LFELAIAFIKDFLVPAFKHRQRRHIVDGAVQTNRIVFEYVFFHTAFGIFQGERRQGPDTITFDRAMVAFDLTVALRVVRTGANVFHSAQSNEVFEVFGDELRSVVRDDSGCHAGVFFASGLENDFDIDLLHFFTNVPMDDTSAESIEDRGHEVERPGDVEVGNVDVPVFMSHERLLKSGSFFRSLIVPLEEPCVAENLINGGGAGILLPFDIGRVGLAIEGGGTVFKELFLPVLEVDDTHAMLVADLRDRHLLDQVLPQNRNFLLRR